MNWIADPKILLLIALLMTMVEECVCQYGNAGGNSYQDYGGEQDYDYPDPDYGKGEVDIYTYPNKVPTREFMCYSCTYTLFNGLSAGLQQCQDPFVPYGVPEVACSGECAKIYIKTSDTQFIITRNCLPNCVEHRDADGFTDCCTGHLCNSPASTSKPSIIWILCILILLLVLST